MHFKYISIFLLNFLRLFSKRSHYFVQVQLYELCREVIFEVTFTLFYGSHSNAVENKKEKRAIFAEFSRYFKNITLVAQRIPIQLFPEAKFSRDKLLDILSKTDWSRRTGVSAFIKDLVDLKLPPGKLITFVTFFGEVVVMTICYWECVHCLSPAKKTTGLCTTCSCAVCFLQTPQKTPAKLTSFSLRTANLYVFISGSQDARVRHLLMVLWSSQANTLPALFWALFYVLKNKEAQKHILAEFEDVCLKKYVPGDRNNKTTRTKNRSWEELFCRIEKTDLDQMVFLGKFVALCAV